MSDTISSRLNLGYNPCSWSKMDASALPGSLSYSRHLAWSGRQFNSVGGETAANICSRKDAGMKVQPPTWSLQAARFCFSSFS